MNTTSVNVLHISHTQRGLHARNPLLHHRTAKAAGKSCTHHKIPSLMCSVCVCLCVWAFLCLSVLWWANVALATAAASLVIVMVATVAVAELVRRMYRYASCSAVHSTTPTQNPTPKPTTRQRQPSWQGTFATSVASTTNTHSHKPLTLRAQPFRIHVQYFPRRAQHYTATTTIKAFVGEWLATILCIVDAK